MTGEWLTGAEGRIVLGVSARNVRLLAKKHGWRTSWAKANGGDAKLFHRDDVLKHAREKGLPIPESLLALETPAPSLRMVTDGLAPEEPETQAWDSIPEKGRLEAAERAATVQGWNDWQASGRGTMTAFVAEWRREHSAQRGVSASRVYEWAKLHKAGGMRALVPGWYLKCSTGPQISQEFKDLFEEKYLTQNRPTVQAAYKMAETSALLDDIAIPTISQVYRYVEQIPVARKNLERYGKKAFDDKNCPHVEIATETIIGNEWWISDHHQLDVACRDERGHLVFPWITVFQDWRSRMWVGWCVHTNPNTDTILQAFARGVREYGLPVHIKVDNGKDYRSALVTGGWQKLRLDVDKTRVRSVMGDFDIDVRFALPYNAKAKPIERTFRIVKEWFSRQFDSYRGGSVAEKPERLKEVLAHPERCPTVGELDALFEDFVQNIYNRMPCRGRGADGKPRRDVFAATRGPLRTVAPESLKFGLMKASRTQKVRRQGVKLRGLWYTWKGAILCQGQEVYLRSDRMVPDTVWVFDLQDRPIAEAKQRQLGSLDPKPGEIEAAMIEKREAFRTVKAFKRAVIRGSIGGSIPDLVRRNRAEAAGRGDDGPLPRPTEITVVEWQRASNDAGGGRAAARRPIDEAQIQRDFDLLAGLHRDT